MRNYHLFCNLQVMVILKVAYWDRIDYTGRSEVKRVEDLSAENEDALFEIFYKKNNQLKYCNGSFYEFVDGYDQERYRSWVKNLDHTRSFNLFYGDGVVD